MQRTSQTEENGGETDHSGSEKSEENEETTESKLARTFLCADDARTPLMSSYTNNLFVTALMLLQGCVLWLLIEKVMVLAGMHESSDLPQFMNAILYYSWGLVIITICSVILTAMVGVGGSDAMNIAALVMDLAAWYASGILFFALSPPDRISILGAQVNMLFGKHKLKISRFWIDTQNNHGCCGVHGISDWFIVPQECCATKFPALHTICIRMVALPRSDASSNWYNKPGCYEKLMNSYISAMNDLKTALLLGLIVFGFGFIVLNSNRVFIQIGSPMMAILRAPPATGLERVNALHPDPYRYLRSSESTMHYKETILNPKLKRPSRLSRFDIAEMVRPHARRPLPGEPCPPPLPVQEEQINIPLPERTESPSRRTSIRSFVKCFAHSLSPSVIRKAIQENSNSRK